MNLYNVDLNLLLALDALLAEENVTRAAQRISIGQPAMSAALNRLRKLFGDELLVRSGTGMEPTALARGLKAPVADVIASIQALLALGGDFDPQADQRTFTIMASDYVGFVLLRPLIKQLATTAPQVRWRIYPVTPDFARLLHRGLVDAAIVPREIVAADAQLEQAQLFVDRYVFAVDVDHPDVSDTVTATQLADMGRLAAHDSRLPALGEQQLAEIGLEPAIELSAPTSLLAPHLLAGTRMIALMLERLVHHFSKNVGIRAVEPPFQLKSVAECLYWSPRQEDVPAHRWLREQIELAARELDRVDS